MKTKDMERRRREDYSIYWLRFLFQIRLIKFETGRLGLDYSAPS